MPFVNSAEAGKVVRLLLRKETTPLETTAEQFGREFPRGEHYKALCAVINQLQASVRHLSSCTANAVGLVSVAHQTLHRHHSRLCDNIHPASANSASRLSSWRRLMPTGGRAFPFESRGAHSSAISAPRGLQRQAPLREPLRLILNRGAKVIERSPQSFQMRVCMVQLFRRSFIEGSCLVLPGRL